MFEIILRFVIYNTAVIKTCTAQKMNFSMKDVLSKCEQI